jgi:hypothetical protein
LARRGAAGVSVLELGARAENEVRWQTQLELLARRSRPRFELLKSELLGGIFTIVPKPDWRSLCQA